MAFAVLKNMGHVKKQRNTAPEGPPMVMTLALVWRMFGVGWPGWAQLDWTRHGFDMGPLCLEKHLFGTKGRPNQSAFQYENPESCPMFPAAPDAN